MDDLQLLNRGMIRLKEMFEGLSVEAGPAMAQLMTRYRSTKEDFAAVIAAVDASYLCRECAGQCCLNGKYRINLFDALARIAEQIPTSADYSRKPSCPYSNESGCTMEPGLRPADCVMFVCDVIDQKLSPQARLTLSSKELVLRECLGAASALTGERMETPLLLWAAK